MFYSPDCIAALPERLSRLLDVCEEAYQRDPDDTYFCAAPLDRDRPYASIPERLGIGRMTSAEEEAGMSPAMAVTAGLATIEPANFDRWSTENRRVQQNLRRLAREALKAQQLRSLRRGNEVPVLPGTAARGPGVDIALLPHGRLCLFAFGPLWLPEDLLEAVCVAELVTDDLFIVSLKWGATEDEDERVVVLLRVQNPERQLVKLLMSHIWFDLVLFAPDFDVRTIDVEEIDERHVQLFVVRGGAPRDPATLPAS